MPNFCPLVRHHAVGVKLLLSSILKHQTITVNHFIITLYTMSMNNQFERFRQMHRLIKFRRTGTPDHFANHLGISKSLLYRLLAEIKEMGGPVHFCHQRQSYAYYESVELQLGFVPAAAARPPGAHQPLQDAKLRAIPPRGDGHYTAQRS